VGPASPDFGFSVSAKVNFQSDFSDGFL